MIINNGIKGAMWKNKTNLDFAKTQGRIFNNSVLFYEKYRSETGCDFK